MKTKLLVVSLALALTGWGCTDTKQPTDIVAADGQTSITVADQTVTNGVITITQAEFAQDVWVVIQADDNGQPGRVLARSTYSGRTISNLRLVVEAGTNSPILHLTVRADNGSKGEYEPDTADYRLTYGGQLIATTIKATYVGSSTQPPVGEPAKTNPNEETGKPVEINIDANL